MSSQKAVGAGPSFSGYLLPFEAIAVISLAIAGALLVSVGSTLLAGALLASVLVLAMGLAVLRQLGLGVALIPLVAAGVPITFGTGTQSAIVFVLIYVVMIFGLWVVRSFLSRRLRLTRSPVNAPLAVLAVVWVVSYLYSDITHAALVWQWTTIVMPRVGQLAVVLISFATMLLAMNVGAEVRWIGLATWGFLFVGVLSLAGFYLHIGLVRSVLSSDGLFTMWFVALAYGQAMFNDRLARWLRIALLVLVAGWVYKAVIIQSIWLSGWIPTLVVLVVITFLRSRRAFALLSIALIIAAIPFTQQLWDAIIGVYQAQVDEGSLSRLGLWAQALQLFGDYPVIGSGPAGYAYYYYTVYRDSQFSLSTHSGYLDILLQTGLVGAAAFAWLFAALGVLGWRATRRIRAGFEGGFVQATFAGLLGVLVAIALGDWLIPFVYNQTIAGFRYTVYSWLFLGMLAGLVRSLDRPQNAGAGFARQN